MRYMKMLRPFPVKALADLLYQTLSCAASLEHRQTRIQIDPPREADEWAEALWHLDNLLWEIAECADRARAGLPEMIDRSDAEAERASSALRAIFDGLKDRQPMPCSLCGGRGCDDEKMACGRCEGTQIDPSDPEFPV